MKRKILLSESHITITYNIIDDILYADWKGSQTTDSVKHGCVRLLGYLEQYKCSKVLNDNTEVTGIWVDVSDWVAYDWFPRMHGAGCEYFAWVYSPDLYSKLSTDKTLELGVNRVIVTTFDSVVNAEAWLKTM